MPQIKAVIFDMDGVIIDSQSRWMPLVQDMYRRLFPHLSELEILELSERIRGNSILDEYGILTREQGLTMDQTAFLEMYDAGSLKLYSEEVELSEHLIEFLDQIQGTHRIALASNSVHAWIDVPLRRFSLAHYFEVVVGADDLKGSGKPSPEIYIQTAQKLGVAVQDCVVIEDSIPGVTAAKAAGMSCIGYIARSSADQVASADIVISSFTEATAALAQLNKGN